MKVMVLACSKYFNRASNPPPLPVQHVQEWNGIVQICQTWVKSLANGNVYTLNRFINIVYLFTKQDLNEGEQILFRQLFSDYRLLQHFLLSNMQYCSGT